MKTNNPPPTRPRSFRRILVSGLTLLAGLTTLVALFYAVENWRGARAWTSTLEDLKSRGEKIAMEDFEPPPVPDDANAAMHPALRCFTHILPDGRRSLRLKTDPPDAADASMAAKWKAFLDWRSSEPEAYSPLYEVLTASNKNPGSAMGAALALVPVLSVHQELMTAVEEALRRPFCQWPPLTSADPRANTVRGEFAGTVGKALMEASRLFYVRKICGAITSGGVESWDEGVGLERYVQAADGHLNIINLLLAASIRAQQEGFVIHLLEFTKPDSARCLKAEAELSAQPSMADVFGESMKGERAYMIAAIESMLAQEDPSEVVRLMSGPATPQGWKRVEHVLREYGPVGWLKQNLANTVRGTGELIEAYDPSMTPVEQRNRASAVLAAIKTKGTFFHWMEESAVGIYDGIYDNLLRDDARQNLLRAALLIAAHRSTTGKAPMSLEELPVELKSRIPMSPWKGDAPRIRRDEAGQWTLAYAGWDETTGKDTDWSIQIRGW